MKKIDYKKLGKKGADKRWAKRYEVIKALSAYGTKDLQNQFIKWPTEVLEAILSIYKNQ